VHRDWGHRERSSRSLLLVNTTLELVRLFRSASQAFCLHQGSMLIHCAHIKRRMQQTTGIAQTYPHLENSSVRTSGPFRIADPLTRADAEFDIVNFRACPSNNPFPTSLFPVAVGTSGLSS
jgi:hypothetical protein